MKPEGPAGLCVRARRNLARPAIAFAGVALAAAVTVGLLIDPLANERVVGRVVTFFAWLAD